MHATRSRSFRSTIATISATLVATMLLGGPALAQRGEPQSI